MTNGPTRRLLAISDLHLGHRPNRAALATVGHYPNDWLIVAGDVGEKPEHLIVALDELLPRFAGVIWTPGNHDLWSAPADPAASTASTRGQARYDELVAICRAKGALTPEDPYVEWPPSAASASQDEPASEAEQRTFVVPMFLLFDYTFRPADVSAEQAIPWARETGVVSGDEQMLDPAPWPSLAAWCAARCEATEARLDALPAGARTVLINHWPLRYDLARPPRVPRFSIWSGTTRTEEWGQRYRARAIVSGHLHMRTTLFRHGVRYEEVSLGYPRDWKAERGIDWYLREILPGGGPDADRFTPPFDPFRSHRSI